MYYVVTGAAGFIGANLVKALNERGETDIIAVDNLEQGDKFANLADCEIADYLDQDDFLHGVLDGRFDGTIAAVLHQGACSDTTESDGRYMMRNNYEYSRELFGYCMEEEVPFLYASSAAVYGPGPEFREDRACERPLNVYGDREQHKGRMASVAFHFFNQYRRDGRVRLFEGSGGYADGEQRRDFVSVEDVVKLNLFFLERPDLGGVFNAGTGRAQSYNDVAVAAINGAREAAGEAALTLDELRARGAIEYIRFPDDLKGKYQSFTQADMGAVRAAGYQEPFLTVEQGVARYCRQLAARAGG